MVFQRIILLLLLITVVNCAPGSSLRRNRDYDNNQIVAPVDKHGRLETRKRELLQSEDENFMADFFRIVEDADALEAEMLSMLTSAPTPKTSPVPSSSPATSEPTDPPETNPPTDPPVTPNPTDVPMTSSPTDPPMTANPTASPTDPPVSAAPTAPPVSAAPTASPTEKTEPPLTAAPSISPSAPPTNQQTESPTSAPSPTPEMPTLLPSILPSSKQTTLPTVAPSPPTIGVPSAAPTVPTVSPTQSPTATSTPTDIPIGDPTSRPTGAPSGEPMPAPTPTPTAFPTSRCNVEDELRSVLIRVFLASVSDFDELATPGTPQNLAWNWIVNMDALYLCPNDPNLAQRYTVAVFYFSTQGGGWFECSAPEDLSDPASIEEANGNCGLAVDGGGSDAWLTPSSECEWGGVACDGEGNVQILDFGKFCQGKRKQC